MIIDSKVSIHENIVSKLVHVLVITSIVIDHHMAIIHIKIGKNLVDDVLLDGWIWNQYYH
jgi:multisubunit Na+/H+ antiporter MnhC subunit